MWCACPTRSPHSPSASSCPKPIPLLNLRPSPAEWAPYPTARTVPRTCERFFCTPAQVPPAFLRRSSASAHEVPISARQVPTSARTSLAAEPKTRSFPRRASAFLLRSPIRRHAKFPPPLAHPSPTSRKLAHSRSVLPLFCAELPPSRPESPSVGTPPPSAEAKPLIGTTRPPAASTPSPHPTQKRPNLTPSRRKNVTLSTHSF